MRAPWLVPAGLLVLLTWASVAQASVSDGDPPPVAELDGSGPSYWGPIPDPADSLRARFGNPEVEPWEWPLHGAWTVVRAPFEFARAGAHRSVLWLEESGTLERIRRLLAPVDLPYGFAMSASAGGLNGIGAGLAFRHDEFLGENNRLRLKLSASSRGNRRVTGGLVLPTRPGSELELGAGYRRRGAARYFGLGPDTSYEDESYFTQEAFWGGAIYDQGLGFDPLSLKLRLMYTTVDNRGPLDADDEDERSVEEVFAGSLPRGWGDRSDGWVLGLALEYDSTHQTGRPSAGWLHRVQAASFRAAGDGSDFVSYRLESQRFFDLWWDRSLAVRSAWSWIDDGGDPVHFQQLLTNDDPDLLRGYDDFRWRDKGLTLLSVEYRYPVWDHQDPGEITVDAYTFFDTGQVFGHRDEIALDTLTRSYGLGFRLSAHGGFVGRVEVGFSEEDTVFRLRADQMFQYSKQGLYHGREPIPLR